MGGCQVRQVQPPPPPPRPSEPPPPRPSEEPSIRVVTRDVKPPHNCEAILKDADSPLEVSSIDLYEKLYVGVYLNQKRKKYWVEKKTNINCFMVFARDLSITWGNDSRYWKWTNLKESTSEEFVDVAELLNVCWLEVSGKLEITNLSPGVKYEVAFEVMLKEPCYGWDVLVNICFTPPDGNKKVCQENLKEKPRQRWIEIPVGDFTTPSLEKGGEIEFSLYEHGGHWKKGLVVKGAILSSSCILNITRTENSTLPERQHSHIPWFKTIFPICFYNPQSYKARPLQRHQAFSHPISKGEKAAEASDSRGFGFSTYDSGAKLM